MTYVYRRKCRHCGSEMKLTLRGLPSVIRVAWGDFFESWERDHRKAGKCLGVRKTKEGKATK